jgi:hypothetical protein
MSWRDLNPGDRIRLTAPMSADPDPIPVGAAGTVLFVTPLKFMGDDAVQIGVKWDNGRTLSLIEIDKWEKIDA